MRGGGGGGGTQTTTNTTVQSNSPWKPSQEYLKDAMSRASDRLEAGEGFNPYPNSTVIPFSGQTRQGMAGVMDLAGRGTPGTDAAYNALTGIASGAEIDQGNPYLMRALEAGADQIQDRIGNEAAAYGRSGSGAMAGRMADSIGDYYGGALAADYNNQRNRQMQAAGMLPALEAARYDPFGRMMDIGGMEEDLATREMIDRVRIWEGNQNAPDQRIANAMGIFAGGGALGGQGSATSTIQQPVQRANPWMQGIGYGLTGLGALGGFM